jgi:hypothetical protein
MPTHARPTNPQDVCNWIGLLRSQIALDDSFIRIDCPLSAAKGTNLGSQDHHDVLEPQVQSIGWANASITTTIRDWWPQKPSENILPLHPLTQYEQRITAKGYT